MWTRLAVATAGADHRDSQSEAAESNQQLSMWIGMEKVHSSLGEAKEHEIQLNDSLFLRKVESSSGRNSSLEPVLGMNPDATTHQICHLELIVFHLAEHEISLHVITPTLESCWKIHRYNGQKWAYSFSYLAGISS